MNRREMLKTSGFGVGSLALTGVTGGAIGFSVLPDPACGLGKNADFYINLATSTLKELSPLLPGAVSIIAKAIGVLGDIKRDYDKGDFTNAKQLLVDLDNVIQQIQNDSGLTSATAKSIFAIAAIAIQTIATFVLATQPAVAAAVLGPAMQRVQQLGSQERADRVFAAVRF